MTSIHLIRVGLAETGEIPRLEILDRLAAGMARVFGISCRVCESVLEAGFAFDPIRNQYHSTAILQAMDPLALQRRVRMLGVTLLDLFVPVLTFVFGEAQMNGPCGVVSVHRLAEEFYGLPADPEKLERRLLIEALHEMGHTFGLRHCRDWQCAMASTHSVERLDLKQPAFCASCKRAIAAL